MARSAYCNAVRNFLLEVIMLCTRHVPLHPALLGRVRGGILSIDAGRAATNLQHIRESQENFNYITWMEKGEGRS